MSKILIIDDSIDLLEALQFFLESKGYEVKCVPTAESVLSSIKSFSPDLVILDIFLNGYDGREICNKLRSLSETKHLCIILFSASDKDVLRYKQYGADGYLPKPFGLNDIIEKIESTLEDCKSQYITK